jgi:hypothetical protein
MPHDAVRVRLGCLTLTDASVRLQMTAVTVWAPGLPVRVESFGLKLTALENVLIAFYDHIKLNGPRLDEQIENMIYTVLNMARAGIPIFGYC